MKAALEAWGASSNLFHEGFAKEVADAKTVAATLANPGVCQTSRQHKSGRLMKNLKCRPISI